MSETIIGRIDEMGQRIDDLEKSIGELMTQVSPRAYGCVLRHVLMLVWTWLGRCGGRRRC